MLTTSRAIPQLLISTIVLLLALQCSAYSQTAINATVIEHPYLFEIQDLTLNGDILYISNYNWLVSMDVSDPAHPVALDTLQWTEWKSSHQVPDWFSSTALYGNYFYGSTREHGIQIFDISDPGNLAVADSFYLPPNPSQYTEGLLYNWNNYLIARRDTMFIYDLTIPTAPALASAYLLPLESPLPDEERLQTYFNDDTIFLASHDSVNTSGHVKIGTMHADGSISFFPFGLYDEFGSWPSFGGFCVSDSLIFLSQIESVDSLSIFSISDIRKPYRLSKIEFRHLVDIKMNGNELYVVTSRVEFFKYDLSNPRSPVLKSYYSDRLDGSYRRIQMIGDYAYITSGIAGLRILYLGETNEVEDASHIPASSSLAPAYPNPFSGSTTITYSLPAQQYISLDVYNTLGRKVQTLYSGIGEPGTHTARLDASALPTGTYQVVLRSGEGVETRTVVVR